MFELFVYNIAFVGFVLLLLLLLLFALVVVLLLLSLFLFVLIILLLLLLMFVFGFALIKVGGFINSFYCLFYLALLMLLAKLLLSVKGDESRFIGLGVDWILGTLGG